MAVVQVSIDGARIDLVHFRYNVVLDRVVYYPLFCLQFILMGLLTNLKCRIGLLARGMYSLDAFCMQMTLY